MPNGAKIVLHLVPLSMGMAIREDFAAAAELETGLRPLFSANWSSTHNFDGFLTYSKDATSSAFHSYSQVFRNGAVEAVESEMLSEGEDGRSIPSQGYEQALIEALPRYLEVQKELGVAAPMIVMLSLIDVAGYAMGVSPRLSLHRARLIERASLIMPEVMADTFDIDPSQLMRTAFDMVWNAAGWPRSMNYNDRGEWVGQRSLAVATEPTLLYQCLSQIASRGRIAGHRLSNHPDKQQV